jgi:transcriptional regulator GlxA family with amidase domain
VARAIAATGGLKVVPDFTFDDAPRIDLLVVPGGFGVRPLLDDERHLAWIAATSATAQRTASVCSGALLLAKIGLLDGRRATTHWGSLERLAALGSGIRVEPGARFVDDGVMTSAGVAAGIDLAFHVVATRHGREVAAETARYIDYPWAG